MDIPVENLPEAGKNMPAGENEADSESTEGKSSDYDFSYLPETVWVKVMEYLPLSDKYHVSTTCHILYDIFNHPSNWRSALMYVVGGDHNFSLMYSCMAPKFKTIVEKFGHYFQHLTISLHGHLLIMEEETRQIVTHMSQVCRLEHLVLQVGLPTSNFHLNGHRPLQRDLKIILSLVDTAFRLKKIEIVSWPMFPEIFNDNEVNVFEAMKKNPKLNSLESLSMFWLKDKQWSERLPLLPSPVYTTSLVSHFRSLQHLALRSSMMSNELLQELATPSRAALLSLQILLMGSMEVDSPSWSALRAKSPRLEVECVIMSRVADAAAQLAPEVPLTAFKILKYAFCSQSLLYSLTEKFKNSLQSFICYNDPTDCEEEMLRLAKTCHRLNALVFHGQIHCNKLLDIAKSREKWNKFEFVEKLITTEAEEDCFDDDVVIGQRGNGDLVQVRLVRFHGQQLEVEREQMLNALSAEVSKRMDHSWRPC